MKLRAALLPLLVYAASGVRPVLDALRPELERAAGEAVELRFSDAASLEKEIGAGAAADLLFADDGTVNRLALDDRIDRPDIVGLGFGTLVVAAAKGSGLKLPGRLDGATAPALARMPFTALVTPPAKTPAGRAARETLDATGIFEDVSGRLRPASTLDEALALLLEGEARVGILPASLAEESALPAAPIEPSLHEPLREAAGIVSSSKRKDAARRLLGAVVSADARRVWKRFGYRSP